MEQVSGDGPSLILVGVDGSLTSLHAGAYAAGMARRQQARLICLYIHSTVGAAAVVPVAASAISEASNDVAGELRSMIDSQRDRLGIDVTFVERHGNPFTEIVQLAGELKVDAVVVGASMRAGHRLVGSLATHLVRVAKWPVTVVP